MYRNRQEAQSHTKHGECTVKATENWYNSVHLKKETSLDTIISFFWTPNITFNLLIFQDKKNDICLLLYFELVFDLLQNLEFHCTRKKWMCLVCLRTQIYYLSCRKTIFVIKFHVLTKTKKKYKCHWHKKNDTGLLR